ncbi:MAG: flagellar basal body-associated FliL family protein [Sulfitobacter sp.]
MSEPDTEQPQEPPKKSKLPLIIGLLLAVLLGAGGFYATWSGMILGVESDHSTAEEDAQHQMPAVAFVDVAPMTVSLSSQGLQQHLRFRASLEVPTDHRENVELLLPRVVDVLNSYLRALELHDLEDRAALTRLRAQMLRRVQIVTGPGMVKDLLVMEFVMN